MFQSVTLYAATLGNDEYHKGLNRCLSPQQADYRRGIVVSIGCIHANFRSRLMRDLNNIRVTTRRQQRKKVKGHYMLPIDERIGAKKRFAKHGIETRKRKQRRVKNFHWSCWPMRSIFNETRSPPRYFFISTFPSFHHEYSRNAAARTTPRRRCKKKALYTIAFFLLYIYTRLGTIFLDIHVCIQVYLFFSFVSAIASVRFG